MGRWFLNLSLAYKLTVLGTSTTAVSMIVLCGALGMYDVALLRDRLVKDTGVLVDMIGATSTGALAFGDSDEAAEMLRLMSVDEQIAAAAILLPNGQTFARYDRQARGTGRPPALRIPAGVSLTTERWHEFRGSQLAMGRPVVLDRHAVGAVYVELELMELNARLRALWQSLAVALVGTVVLAAGIGWRLQRYISAPLVRLADTARTVGRTRNYTVRAEKFGDDEVGELVDGFNEMLEHIRQRDARLQSHGIELERTVKQRTAELEASVERYKLLVESTHAVPWEIDGWTGTFSYISPQAMKLFGYENQALIGRLSMADLVHPDDRAHVRDQLKALPTSGTRDLELDYRVVNAYNYVIDVRSVVSAHIYSDGRVVLRGITLDLTRQKKLEIELRQAQKLESVGRLAAGVAHEINTPVQFINDSVHFLRDAMSDLTGLLGEYQALQRAALAGEADVEGRAAQVAAAAERSDLEYLLENVPKALDRSLDGLDRVATIVRSMKEFAHPDQKEMGAVDLNQAIRSTLVIARSEYKYVADVETDLEELPAVRCHAGEINQVLLNVLVNAAHAVEDVVKGTENRGRIAIQTRHAGDYAVIRISDTGNGIPEEIRERIFDPFFTTKDVGKGTGQGLAMARAVVLDKHGGTLTFDTEPGRGTTFIIGLLIDGPREIAAA